MGMFGSIARALSNPDTLSTIGAGLKDVGASLNGDEANNLLSVQKMLAVRKAEADKQAFAQKLGGMFGGSFMPQAALPVDRPTPPGAIDERLPRSGGLNANSPELAQLAVEAQNAGYNMDDVLKVLQMQKPEAPRVIEGTNGIYREQPDHSFNLVQPYPQPVPFGWEIGPDGNPRPRNGGPADPAYIARTAGVRRDAVVARPMPTRPHAANPNTIKWD